LRAALAGAADHDENDAASGAAVARAASAARADCALGGACLAPARVDDARERMVRRVHHRCA
jgi:hypothetical protein